MSSDTLSDNESPVGDEGVERTALAGVQGRGLSRRSVAKTEAPQSNQPISQSANRLNRKKLLTRGWGVWYYRRTFEVERL